MEDLGHSVEVREYEAGWSFLLQGDDAQQFREEWEMWKEIVGNDFRDFLSSNEYDTLFQ